MKVKFFAVGLLVISAALWLTAGGGSQQIFNDGLFKIYSNVETTRRIKFDAHGVADSTTRTIYMPDNDVNLGELGGGGFTKWDDIGNPDADDEIDFASYIAELNIEDFRIGDGGSNYVKFNGTPLITFLGTADIDLPDNSVDNSDLSDNSVDSAEYIDDSIDDVHINWGGGTDQVNSDDVPEGSTNLYQLTEEEAEDYVGGMLGGTETHISVDYQDSTNDIDFVVDPDSVAGSISAGSYADDTVQAADIDTINCGTNCTWDTTNDEIDIDDAFLTNNAADELIASADGATVLIVRNTDGTLSSETYLLELQQTADGSSNGDFIKCTDAYGGSPATLFNVEYNGNVTTPGHIAASQYEGYGEADTYMAMASDVFSMVAGGVTFATLQELFAGQDIFVVNTNQADVDFTIHANGGSNLLRADAATVNVSINGSDVAISANYDLALLGDGVLMLKETSTPTADTDYGKLYCKNDNKIYFQDGANNEHRIGYAPWDDIDDLTADDTIAFGGFEATITTTLDETGHTTFTLDHTDTDTTNTTSLFEIRTATDNDGDLTFINIVDDTGGTPNQVFYVKNNGSTYIDGSLTCTLGFLETANINQMIDFAGQANPTTDSEGEIAVDQDAWGSGYDAIEFYNDTHSAYIVATQASDTPSNGQVPTFNTGGLIDWQDPPGAGGGDPVLVDTTAITDGAGVDLTSGTGVNITLNEGVSPDTATFDFVASEISGGTTWDDGGEASVVWQWNLTAGDPAITFGNGIVNISSGALQEGGNAVWNSSETDIVSDTHINWASLSYLGEEGAITVDDSTSTTCYVALWESATGDLPAYSDGGLTYNASTANLSTTTFTGALSGNASTCTTASAGDAAADFFGAGVHAVTDGTACTDIEGTGLSISVSTLNWSAASTDLTDTADLLYENELDEFSELQSQIADKTLVNTADGATWAGTHDFKSATVKLPARVIFCFNIKDIDDSFDDIKMPFPVAMTITQVTAYVTGGTNVVGRLYEVDGDGDDGDAVGVETSDWTFTTGETEDTSFNNATFDAGDYIQWDTTSVSGTVTGFSLTVWGYET